MAVIDVISSVLSGGITGVLGAGITRFADYKNKQLDLQASREKFSHEVEMRKADAEIMAQEWAARTKVADIEATAKMEAADTEAFKTALTVEPQRYYEGKTFTTGQAWAMIMLDVLRGIVRPALTVYLMAITTLVYREARVLLGDGSTLAPDIAVALVDKIINTLLYLCNAACLFWFGTRPSKREKWK